MNNLLVQFPFFSSLLLLKTFFPTIDFFSSTAFCLVQFSSIFYNVMKMYAYNTKVSNLQHILSSLAIYLFRLNFNATDLLLFKLYFFVIMVLQVSISIRPDLESMILFIMLNEYSTIGPVKMLTQGRTKVLNTGYLFILNTLFHQTSDLSKRIV